MVSLEISTSQLKRDTKKLRTAAESAAKELENFKSEMDALNGMWEGKANLAFRAQVAKDYSLMGELLDRMDTLASCMENAGAEYVACENAVMDVVDGIKI